MPTEQIGLNEPISQEDISIVQEVLASKGISIKELVNEYKSFKAGENLVVKEKNATKKKNYSSKPDVSFELATSDYPDFCIRRKTAKTEKLLVVMVSCNGYFIKNIKKNSKGEEVEISREPLTRENYAQFTSGMEDIFLDDFWLPKIYSGVGFFDKYFSHYLKDETVQEMIKKHCSPGMNDWNYYPNEYEVNAFKTVPNLFREFYQDEVIRDFISEGTKFIEEIQKTYSLEQARIFLTKLKESNLKDISGSEWTTTIYKKRKRQNNDDDDDYEDYDDSNVFNRYLPNTIEPDNEYYSESGSSRPNIPMEFDKFCDYVLVQSVRMGYRKYIDRFFNEWNDCLRMQHQLSGKITNKYPSSLATYHMCLSCEYEDAKIEIDKKELAKQAKYASQFEGTYDDYVFIAPKSKEDILDEAQQQSNCLASYVEKYTHGRCLLFFMRKKSSPKNSLVTIEVVGRNITQKYQAWNKSCTDEQNKVIEKWFKQKFQKNGDLNWSLFLFF